MSATKHASDAALANSPLGHATPYPDRYEPGVLFSVPRGPQRKILGLTDALPFEGADFWTAYEVAWLDVRGKPQTAVMHLSVPARSTAMVESKSLKLYLGSYAQEPVASPAQLRTRVETDVAATCGAPVRVTLTPADQVQSWRAEDLPGQSIDQVEVTIDTYEPDPGLLSCTDPIVDESLRSALFRSTCPVTGQPDYADVLVRYRGPRIDHPGLLRYLVSYRKHEAFHEACIERIFVDIERQCRPRRLTVYARFLRRGGIDINPYRSNFDPVPTLPARTPRQ